jgi:polyisoprenoid-binding protein YceI
MKNLTLLFLSFFLSNLLYIDPVIYVIDSNKSNINWTGYAETGNYAPSGSIKIKSGMFGFNGKTLTTGQVVIAMPTISHSNKELESHLKAADFFDVGKYQEAVFTLKTMKDNTVSGNLTIKGITQAINFPIVLTKNTTGLTLKAKIKVDRTLFGIKYNSKSYFQDIGSYAIKNEFDLDIQLELCKR